MYRNNWLRDILLGKLLQHFHSCLFTYNKASFKLSLKKTGVGTF